MPVSVRKPHAQPLHPDALARFVDPLPIPPVLEPDGMRPDPDSPGQSIAYYRVPMREVAVAVHRDVPPTRVWSYAGIFPGPTLETRSGKGLLVEWVNELPEHHFLPIDHSLCGAGADRPEVRTVVHVHGARVPPESDGYPEDWYAPGGSATHHYPSQQEAATLWYHDHAMGLERLNQYAGLFGFYLIRDDVEDAIRLPSAPYEVPLMLCDRLFDALRGSSSIRPRMTHGRPGFRSSPEMPFSSTGRFSRISRSSRAPTGFGSSTPPTLASTISL